MNNRKTQDLAFGMTMEQRIQPTLQETFGDLHNNNDENKFAHIDFKNDLYGVEYKRRRLTFGRYPTLFFEMFKVDEAKKYVKEGKRVFFIWHCDDGLYYWEYDEDQWFSAWGGRRDRGKIEESDLCNVKNEYIKPLDGLTLTR